MAICGAAVAFQFNEKIEVEGDGNLFARTNTDAAKDQINGTGDQNYIRNLNLQKSATTLESEYGLRSNLSGRTNHYYAQMNSPDGLEHFISVYADSDISSVSIITQSENQVSTDFMIESKSATLSEGITDSSDGKTRNEIAETEILGSFNLKSNLVDDGKMVDSPSSFDPESMMEKLESVDMASETGRIDVTVSETEVFLVGEPKKFVKSIPSTKLTLPDGTTGSVSDGESTISEVLSDGTEGELETFGEVIREDEEELIIVGTVIGVPDKAEEPEGCLDGSGIKEIDGRRIAFIGYRPRTPLGWNPC
ncbi:MAG TPA: hypothetical protein HA349_09690 [Methanotrichaceae archaeon]|nr:hypothetical protein [Methanotrichaceae archaeon]